MTRGGRRCLAACRPGPERGGSSTIPARFRGRARRDAAAFYLSELAKGVLSGEVSVGSGEQHTALATSEFVLLEIEASEKKGKAKIEIAIAWRHGGDNEDDD